MLREQRYCLIHSLLRPVSNSMIILQCIPYSVLLEELDIKNVRDLEDLIIEAIYAGIYL